MCNADPFEPGTFLVFCLQYDRPPPDLFPTYWNGLSHPGKTVHAMIAAGVLYHLLVYSSADSTVAQQASRRHALRSHLSGATGDVPNSANSSAHRVHGRTGADAEVGEHMESHAGPLLPTVVGIGPGWWLGQNSHFHNQRGWWHRPAGQPGGDGTYDSRTAAPTGPTPIPGSLRPGTWPLRNGYLLKPTKAGLCNGDGESQATLEDCATAAATLTRWGPLRWRRGRLR